jgi:VanZ family protein
LRKPSLQSLARNWWPVLGWLGIIRLESTDMASAQHTSQIVYKLVATVYPRAQPTVIEQLDEILRKSGHFIGYGVLSGLVFLALKRTNRDLVLSALGRVWGVYVRDFWRWEWVAVGMIVSVITASLDEMHQTLFPSRTGRWQDVVLDTCGAIVLQIVIYLLSLRAFGRRRGSVPQPEFSSSR